MNMPITYWMLAPLRKYATFGGRAPRAEFWWFWLFSACIIGGTIIADFIVFGASTLLGGGSPSVFSGLAALALALPTFAVQVRRLHDQDKTGWFVLIGLLPLIGGLILFWFNLQRGTPGPNRYGDNPLEERKFFT